mmetsp:Transcript_20818/g.60855  ORF Transcript_20818/g.60855 Transcript_20818/m.60855 type:complete len:221 (+) Transcript_20818:315-977(+)
MTPSKPTSTEWMGTRSDGTHLSSSQLSPTSTAKGWCTGMSSRGTFSTTSLRAKVALSTLGWRRSQHSGTAGKPFSRRGGEGGTATRRLLRQIPRHPLQRQDQVLAPCRRLGPQLLLRLRDRQAQRLLPRHFVAANLTRSALGAMSLRTVPRNGLSRRTRRDEGLRRRRRQPRRPPQRRQVERQWCLLGCMAVHVLSRGLRLDRKMRRMTTQRVVEWVTGR